MDEVYLACSVDQQGLIDPIIAILNAKGSIQFKAVYYPDKDVIQPVLFRDFGLILPNSALGLQDLEDQWEERHGPIDRSMYAQTVTFAVTPLVFFISPRTAHRLRVFDEPFGWKSLLSQINPMQIRLRHASVRERDGVAVAIGEHLAFAAGNKPSEELAAEVKSAEQAVEEYGPDDGEVLRRATREGEWTTDIVIAQERSIVAMAKRAPKMSGVIVYPHDGILALPNTLATISGWERPRHEEAFRLLASGLTGLDAAELARHGLHQDAASLVEPGALKEFASVVGSQTGTAVRWAAHAGGTTLMLPGRRAVRSIRALAGAAKHPVDVCLLFDSSSSMAQLGKFPQALAAVDDFLSLLQGAGSRACLIRFQSEATILTPLQAPFKPFYPPTSLNPDGGTALLDAVELGLNTLEASGKSGHIWAIVAFTDGRENASRTSLPAVELRLKRSSRVRFYGVAYGGDADIASLTVLANGSGGAVERGDQTTIRALYERLSTYV